MLLHVDSCSTKPCDGLGLGMILVWAKYCHNFVISQAYVCFVVLGKTKGIETLLYWQVQGRHGFGQAHSRAFSLVATEIHRLGGKTAQTLSHHFLLCWGPQLAKLSHLKAENLHSHNISLNVALALLVVCLAVFGHIDVDRSYCVYSPVIATY